MDALRRRGFTVVEVVTVMMVMSVLTRMSMPQMDEVLTRARATEVRASFKVVEEAAMRLSVENEPWPDDAEPGVVPPELVDRLPEGFSFDREQYQLDWEHWSLPGGMPDDSSVRDLIGVSITTEDRSLGVALMDLIPSNAKFELGETYTFIFATR